MVISMNTFQVVIEVEGMKYSASAVVESGMLTVKSTTLGSKSASVSGDNNVLASILLRELVNQSKGRGW